MTAGTLTLSGSNGYTGGTAVSGGLLSVSALNDTANSNLPISSTLTLSGGTLQYTGTGDTTNRHRQHSERRLHPDSELQRRPHHPWQRQYWSP